MNSKAKGEKTEAIILAKLLSLGYAVSIPFGNNQRYDMIYDDNISLVKVQCKTSTYKNGCVCFNSRSTNGFTGKTRGYKGEIDYFLVYSPHINRIYRIPVNEVGETSVFLRVEPNNGGVINKIRWAKHYEI